MSDLYKLDRTDFIKGAISAVLGAIFVTIYGVVNQAGFDLFSVNWSAILQMALNGAVAAFFGYVAKNFFSDSEGNPLGIKV